MVLPIITLPQTNKSTPQDVFKSVWISAWCATAASSNCYDIEVCDNYADICLHSFKERFVKTGGS
jgi:hypothetical protein